ncbi:MAG: hypothetical protein AAGM67_21120 [Bacteroidota bacterium]
MGTIKKNIHQYYVEIPAPSYANKGMVSEETKKEIWDLFQISVEELTQTKSRLFDTYAEAAQWLKAINTVRICEEQRELHRKYAQMRKDLMKIREKHNQEESDEEDIHLEEMDDLYHKILPEFEPFL